MLAKYPPLLDLVEQVFGPNIALYNMRFVVKDRHSRGPVFLHQDIGYHYGWPRKLSAFVALSESGALNGGVKFCTGTHRFGYLSDAGQINRMVMGNKFQWQCPQMESGDVVLMHSALWHESFAHISGPDRILADIIYQPADDPSGIELLRGEWKTDVFLTPEMRENLFVRSRSSRLKELQAEVDSLKIAKQIHFPDRDN